MSTLKWKSGSFEYLFISCCATIYRFDCYIAHMKRRSTFLRLHGHQGRLLPHICGLQWAQLCLDLVLRVYPRLCLLCDPRDGGTSRDGELQRVCQYWHTVLWLYVESMAGLEGQALLGTAWWTEIKHRGYRIESGEKISLIADKFTAFFGVHPCLIQKGIERKTVYTGIQKFGVGNTVNNQ